MDPHKHVIVQDHGKGDEAISNTGEQDGRHTTFRFSDSTGQAIAADALADGTFRLEAKGRSPQGEEGNLEVGQILIEYLNSREGGNWGPPYDPNRPGRPDEDDLVSKHRDRKEELKIQVTRPAYKTDFLHELNVTGQANRTINLETAVEALWEAINAKPPHRDLALALNALTFPDLAFGQVAQAFRRQYGLQAHQCGFCAIWLVAPNNLLITRLDIADPMKAE